MSKFKMMYKIMYDDLKDADMLIDYAKEIKEEDKDIADVFAKNAITRLDHLKEIHKIFQSEAGKETSTTKDTVEGCLWEETHEHMVEWYKSIEKCIKEY